MFGTEKNRFLPYLCLVYYAIIYRKIYHQRFTDVPDEFALFDQIYWELKGELTTKQAMDSMINQGFYKDLYYFYLIRSKKEIKDLSQTKGKL